MLQEFQILRFHLIRVTYHIVDTVTQLTRLAISKDNGVSLLISAIGTTKTDNRACIIELEDTGSSLWAARIEQIEANYEIFFSDINTGALKFNV